MDGPLEAPGARDLMAQDNPARRAAYFALCETLGELKGRAGVSEERFCSTWLRRMTADPALSREGWYQPPPLGVSVLFATADAPARLAFQSLRLQEWWPGTTCMNWERGLLFAYSSLIHIPTGIPGDFAITLYFGKNQAILDHFRNAHAAVSQVLASVQPAEVARDLALRADRIFRAHDLHNPAWSLTDPVGTNLGHSLPCLGSVSPARRRINTAWRERVSRQRKFVNTGGDWVLGSQRYVTIEPQLMSTRNKDLPKVTFHYVLSMGQPCHLQNEGDALLRQLGLASPSKLL